MKPQVTYLVQPMYLVVGDVLAQAVGVVVDSAMFVALVRVVVKEILLSVVNFLNQTRLMHPLGIVVVGQDIVFQHAKVVVALVLLATLLASAVNPKERGLKLNAVVMRVIVVRDILMT